MGSASSKINCVYGRGNLVSTPRSFSFGGGKYKRVKGELGAVFKLLFVGGGRLLGTATTDPL